MKQTSTLEFLKYFHRVGTQTVPLMVKHVMSKPVEKRATYEQNLFKAWTTYVMEEGC